MTDTTALPFKPHPWQRSLEHGGMRRRPEPGGGDQSDVLAGTALDFDAIIRPEVLDLRGVRPNRALP
jgi:hypothetical protein